MEGLQMILVVRARQIRVVKSNYDWYSPFLCFIHPFHPFSHFCPAVNKGNQTLHVLFALVVGPWALLTSHFFLVGFYLPFLAAMHVNSVLLRCRYGLFSCIFWSAPVNTECWGKMICWNLARTAIACDLPVPAYLLSCVYNGADIGKCVVCLLLGVKLHILPFISLVLAHCEALHPFCRLKSIWSSPFGSNTPPRELWYTVSYMWSLSIFWPACSVWARCRRSCVWLSLDGGMDKQYLLCIPFFLILTLSTVAFRTWCTPISTVIILVQVRSQYANACYSWWWAVCWDPVCGSEYGYTTNATIMDIFLSAIGWGMVFVAFLLFHKDAMEHLDLVTEGAQAFPASVWNAERPSKIGRPG